MRFEVKAGGLTAILAGLAVLSGVVFVLGLLAGYDVGRESQTDAQKVSTDYPLTAPPATAQSPSASEGHALVEGTVPAAPAAPPAPKPPPAPVAPALVSNPKPPVEAAAPVNQPKVIAPPPAAAAPAHPAPPADEAMASTAHRPSANESVRKPFNIEIQAAMDSTSAGQMVRRLEALGYQPHMQPTQINGATWYKVEVGPYATQAEAAAAESELRQKYNSTYGHGGAPAQPADADQAPEE